MNCQIHLTRENLNIIPVSSRLTFGLVFARPLSSLFAVHPPKITCLLAWIKIIAHKNASTIVWLLAWSSTPNNGALSEDRDYTPQLFEHTSSPASLLTRPGLNIFVGKRAQIRFILSSLGGQGIEFFIVLAGFLQQEKAHPSGVLASVVHCVSRQIMWGECWLK